MNHRAGPHSLAERLALTQAGPFPCCPEFIPVAEVREGRYWVRFARTRAELDAVLKLRFEVFNLELGEGLDDSYQTGRDLDEFDAACHHLIVLEESESRVVGTYRMQTSEMAAAGRGFYSGLEFDLGQLPSAVLTEAIELGRACIARPHRHTQVLFLMWKALAAYLAHNRKRYLFGCCSLSSQDAREGARASKMLAQGGHLHPTLFAPAQPGFECAADDRDEEGAVSIPRLFRTYLRFGARVCSPPAIDRVFKTIDFLVILDVNEIDYQTRKLFLGA